MSPAEKLARREISKETGRKIKDFTEEDKQAVKERIASYEKQGRVITEDDIAKLKQPVKEQANTQGGNIGNQQMRTLGENPFGNLASGAEGAEGALVSLDKELQNKVEDLGKVASAAKAAGQALKSLPSSTGGRRKMVIKFQSRIRELLMNRRLFLRNRQKKNQRAAGSREENAAYVGRRTENKG